eukprot:1695390-Prymnesium_polylepis.1
MYSPSSKRRFFLWGWYVNAVYSWSMRFWSTRSVVVGRHLVEKLLPRLTQSDIAEEDRRESLGCSRRARRVSTCTDRGLSARSRVGSVECVSVSRRCPRTSHPRTHTHRRRAARGAAAGVVRSGACGLRAVD